jgi:hypothetical protein
MKLKNYYVGLRADWSLVNRFCKRQVTRLNQGLADELRSASLLLGIKKTEQGKRLDFYKVDEIELGVLMQTECRPLVKLTEFAVIEICEKLGNVKEPNAFNDYKKYANWKDRYKITYSKNMQVIGKDLNPPPKRSPKPVNPYKIGDLVYEYKSYSSEHKLGRVCKITESSYWLEYANLRNNVGGCISIKDRLAKLKKMYKKVKTHYMDDWRWSITIPYSANKDNIVFYGESGANRVTQSTVNYPCIVLEKDAEYKEETDLGWN